MRFLFPVKVVDHTDGPATAYLSLVRDAFPPIVSFLHPGLEVVFGDDPESVLSIVTVESVRWESPCARCVDGELHITCVEIEEPFDSPAEAVRQAKAAGWSILNERESYPERAERSLT